MIGEYNPFRKKENRDTRFGILNFNHDLGYTYVTHRQKSEFYENKNCFMILDSEIEICNNEYMRWIIIMYHRDNGCIPLRIIINNVHKLNRYYINNRCYYGFDINKMETIINGEWVKNGKNLQEL